MNNKIVSLRQMNVGQKGKIAKVDAKGEVNQRIRDMGIIPGASVSVVGRAPLKDPVALRLAGITVSLTEVGKRFFHYLVETL